DATKGGRDPAQYGERRGLAAALFLGKAARGGRHRERDAPLLAPLHGDAVAGQNRRQQREQYLAAAVEGRERQCASAPHDLEWRIGEAELPARIAVGVLDAGRK